MSTATADGTSYRTRVAATSFMAAPGMIRSTTIPWTLAALPVNDFLSGGEGNDVIRARGGNDFMSGGNGQDELDGGEGSDTADYSEKLDAVTLTLNGPNDVKVLVDGVVEDTIRNTENANGGGGGDRLAGDGFNNAFAGNAGDDKITGNLGNDDLSGGDGNDKLDGGDGNDRIAGGLGNDRLVGGKTSDTLVFDTALHAKNNVDKVKKFSHAKDTVELDQAVFTELDLGALKGKHFHLGEKAKDGNDRIIYDEADSATIPTAKAERRRFFRQSHRWPQYRR